MDCEEEKILISVIVPTFNREKIIIRTINSVHNQTHRPIELIIVDDGSTDFTKNTVLEWKKNNESENFMVRYIYKRNEGAPAARNHGMKQSSGRYIQFLDSDDFMDFKKISIQLEAIKISNAEIVVCDFVFVDHLGRELTKIKNFGNVWFKYANGGSLSLSTPLFKRSLIETGLEWNEILNRNQDVDFLFKLVLLTRAYFYTEGYLFYYVQHPNSRISDTYRRTPTEFKKRIKSLLKFGFNHYKDIPIKNWIYLYWGILFLMKDWILYQPKILLKKQFPSLSNLKNAFSNK